MKVTSDSIHLGSRVEAPDEATSALDIGTGTGIVALCLAQRFPNLNIDAIEIDPQAEQQASENFSASPYASRLTAICQDVKEYQPNKRYDLIVSNPPYYSNPLKSPDPQRDLARGDSGLTFDSLTTKIAELLAPHGVASVIIPTESAEKFCKIAQEKGFFLRKRIDIFSNFDSPSKRVLLTFSLAGKIFWNDF